MLQKKTMVKTKFNRTIIPGGREKTTDYPTVLNVVGLKHSLIYILIYGCIRYPYTQNSSKTMTQLGLHTREIYTTQMGQYRKTGTHSWWKKIKSLHHCCLWFFVWDFFLSFGKMELDLYACWRRTTAQIWKSKGNKGIS